MTDKRSWRSMLEDRIKRDVRMGDIFTIDEVYEYVPEFQEEHPGSRFPKSHLRDTMQSLRDDPDPLIEFMGPHRGHPNAGIYRRIK
jgi:hypothetical protein